MPPQLIARSANIVLIGDFNPVLFQPAWFANVGLLRPPEAESAKVDIIHPQICSFATDWLTLRVELNRFQAVTAKDAYLETLRDLVIGVLQLLKYTPVKLVGLNRESDYSMDSEDTWHELGHRLAPKQGWQDVLKQPGMRSLVMQGTREDGRNGYVQVKVEPTITSQNPHGVNVSVNDHYDLTALAREVSNQAAIEIVNQRWVESVKAAERTIDHVVRLGDIK